MPLSKSIFRVINISKLYILGNFINIELMRYGVNLQEGDAFVQQVSWRFSGYILIS